jgi:hypothetical protein
LGLTFVIIKTNAMRKSFLIILSLFLYCSSLNSQIAPCNSDPGYRQFDFWIGEWEVYGLKGQKAGDSKIELILDSCIILENWKSASNFRGRFYSGKSFNRYNISTRQWQQFWVDNLGGSTDYSQGHFENNKMIFQTQPYLFIKDTMAILRLTFYNISPDKVRQQGEISKDNGIMWTTQYDLEYRRKKF